MCHNRIMQQVLSERIVGGESEEKYRAALILFMTELRVDCRFRETEHGVVFVFTPWATGNSVIRKTRV